MSKEIEVKVAPEIESKKIEVGEWGLTFDGQLTPKEWYEAALEIQKYDGKIQWYLGDLAVYAESLTTGWNVKNKAGVSKYDEMIAGTGYDYNTLTKFAMVARRFPIGLREKVLRSDANRVLSFSHFYRVAPIKEDNFAEYWLKKSADNGWGVAKLREEIYKWKLERGEINEKEEESIGYVSFNDFRKEFFKDFSPRLSNEEYDKKSWLLEVRDVIDEELEKMGVINA